MKFMQKIVILVFGTLFLGAGCTDGSLENRQNTSVFSKSCTEPENPYSSNSGHYAGFEWGEEGNDCGGNSTSFIEGCENYQMQDEQYTDCLEK